jgi:hypothetical protein
MLIRCGKKHGLHHFVGPNRSLPTPDVNWTIISTSHSNNVFPSAGFLKRSSFSIVVRSITLSWPISEWREHWKRNAPPTTAWIYHSAFRSASTSFTFPLLLICSKNALIYRTHPFQSICKYGTERRSHLHCSPLRRTVRGEEARRVKGQRSQWKRYTEMDR